jgi:hypothetical protein
MGCGASRCGGGRAAVAAVYYAPPPEEEWPPPEAKRKLERMVAKLTGDMIRAAFVGWADDARTEKNRREDGRLRILRKFQARSVAAALEGWRDRAREQKRLKDVAGKATRRLLAGKLAAAFNRWHEYVAQVVGARRILARIFKGVLFSCFEAWQDDYHEAREEKRAAAARIQAMRRGQMKRRGMQEQKAAITKIQGLYRGKQARTAASGIAARMKALEAGLDKPKPSALNSLLEDIVGSTADVVDVKPSLQVPTGRSSGTRLSTAALARLAKALLPHAPLTDAELEMLGVGSGASRKALLRHVGASTVVSKESKARRKAAAKTTGWLEASVRAARGLKKMDMGPLSSSDPYAVVRVGAATQQTEVVKKSRDPTWDATLRFEDVDPNSSVIVRLYDWDRASHDDPMGQVVVRMEDIEEGRYASDTWHPLAKMEDCDDPQGEIQFAITAEFPEPEAEEEEEPEPAYQPPGAKPKVGLSWGARLRGVGDVAAQQRRRRELLGAASAVAAAGHISVSHAAAESYEAMLHSGYDLEREAGHGGSLSTGATSFHAGGRHGAEVYGAVKSAAIQRPNRGSIGSYGGRGDISNGARERRAAAAAGGGAGGGGSRRRSPPRRSPPRDGGGRRRSPPRRSPPRRSPPRRRDRGEAYA